MKFKDFFLSIRNYENKKLGRTYIQNNNTKNISIKYKLIGNSFVIFNEKTTCVDVSMHSGRPTKRKSFVCQLVKCVVNYIQV